MLTVTSLAECGRILVAAPVGTKSHQNTYVALLKALAGRGHDVTLLTGYPVHQLGSNINHIQLDGLEMDPALFSQVFDYALNAPNNRFMDVFNSFLWVVVGWHYGTEWSIRLTNATYSDPRVLQLLHNETYDMVLCSQVYQQSLYPMAWHWNASLAIFSVVIFDIYYS